MKALRKMRPQRGAQLETVAIPAIGPTDCLVRVRAASICGTDLHIYGWDRWSASRIHPPMTFGHEFCGVIEKIGDEITSVEPGDFVSAEMHVNCGYCRPCRMGQPHVCQNVKIIGIDADGCFAEFVRIPARNIWKIDPKIPEHYAAILDPLGNAVHTVTAGEIAGQNVLVTGTGPIGLMSINIARACGCALLFATEVNAHRRELALEMGADEVFDPAQPGIVEHVRGLTEGGVDVLLEMSGNPEAIRQGFQMLRQGGRASLLGIPKDVVTLDLVNDVIFKGATVQGIYGRRMFETWVHMTELLKHNRLNLEPLFHERLPLEKFESAFALLESGQAGKVLFYPNGSPNTSDLPRSWGTNRAGSEEDGVPLAENDAGVDVQFDSQGSYLEVRNPRMYDLVRNNVFSSHLLALVAQAPGFVPHSSTYGNDCQRDFDQM